MSAKNVNVYWHGIIGIAGKGPNWSEIYDCNKTIEQVIQNMTACRLNERKKIEILKFKNRIDNYDKSDPFWPRNTKLSEVLQHHGIYGQDLMLVYLLV